MNLYQDVRIFETETFSVFKLSGFRAVLDFQTPWLTLTYSATASICWLPVRNVVGDRVWRQPGETEFIKNTMLIGMNLASKSYENLGKQ